MFLVWFSIFTFLRILRIRSKMALSYRWSERLISLSEMTAFPPVSATRFEVDVYESMLSAKSQGISCRQYCERITQLLEKLKSSHLDFIGGALVSQIKLIFMFTTLGILYVIYAGLGLSKSDYAAVLSWICSSQILLLVFCHAASHLKTVGQITMDEIVSYTTFSIGYVRNGSNCDLIEELQIKIKKDARMGRSCASYVRSMMELEFQKLPLRLKANRKIFSLILVFFEMTFLVPLLLHISFKFLENSHSF